MSKTAFLSSGYEMPMVGLGTWQSPEDEVETAVTAALECGYRHIDTAFFYQNEEAIGRSLKKWFDEGHDRDEVFVTTKLPFYANRPSDVETYMNYSLESLGLDYVDMYLNHMPFATHREKDNTIAIDDDGNILFDYGNDIVAVWKEMESLVKNGKTRSIGISNFNESQIARIIENSEIKPSNLQVELHAYLQQRSLREFCSKYGIVVTAYSSLGSPGTVPEVKSESYLSFPNLLEHPVVKKIAEAHGKSEAQILLRHQVQEGVVVVPKSVTSERIQRNIDIYDFELTDDEIIELDELDKGEEGRMFHMRNLFKGIENHPEYPYNST